MSDGQVPVRFGCRILYGGRYEPVETRGGRRHFTLFQPSRRSGRTGVTEPQMRPVPPDARVSLAAVHRLWYLFSKREIAA
jgi:hypothetical protein